MNCFLLLISSWSWFVDTIMVDSINKLLLWYFQSKIASMTLETPSLGYGPDKIFIFSVNVTRTRFLHSRSLVFLEKGQIDKLTYHICPDKWPWRCTSTLTLHIYIGNMGTKFELPTIYSSWDMARTRFLHSRSLVFIYTAAVTFTKVKCQFDLDVAYLPHVGHICPNLEVAICYTYGDMARRRFLHSRSMWPWERSNRQMTLTLHTYLI